MNLESWRNDGVLIVGGGIAGLALAGALYRQGVACELIERAPAWAPVGDGIVLGVNAMKMLRDATPQSAPSLARGGLRVLFNWV